MAREILRRQPQTGGAVVHLALLEGGQRLVRQRQQHRHQHARGGDPLLRLLLGHAGLLDALQVRLGQVLLVLLLALQALLLFLEQALFRLVQEFGHALVGLRLLLGQLACVRLRGLDLGLRLGAGLADGLENTHGFISSNRSL